VRLISVCSEAQSGQKSSGTDQAGAGAIIETEMG